MRLVATAVLALILAAACTSASSEEATAPTPTTPTATAMPTVTPAALTELQVADSIRLFVLDQGAYSVQVVTIPDGQGGWLAAATGTWIGANPANDIYFFHNLDFLGNDNALGIQSVSAGTEGAIAGAEPLTFTATYPRYLPGEPRCCPTGGQVSVIFKWTVQGDIGFLRPVFEGLPACEFKIMATGSPCYDMASWYTREHNRS